MSESGPKRKPAGQGEPADDEDERHRAGGLTDRDCYALLSAGGMGGRNGFTLADYAALSDRQIIALLGVEWDEDGRLVCEGDEPRDGGGEPTGSIRHAGRELQSPEQLGLSEDDLRWATSIRPMVSMFFLSMFWSVWQKRGKTNDEIKQLWLEHLMSDR